MSNAADSLLAMMRKAAGKRSRLDGLNVLNAWIQAERCDIVVGRGTFRSALEVLKSAGRVRLPAGNDHWDFSTRDAVPKWIVLVQEARKPGFNPKAHPWHPQIGFLGELAALPNADDMLALDRWLRGMPADEPIVPVKERSWEIFGNEKKLEGLAVFKDGRVPAAALRCYVVPHIPVHKVYPNAEPTLIISENEAGFESLCRIADKFRVFACVVFGDGFAIEKCVSFLKQFVEEKGIISCEYLGDVDSDGIAIPIRLQAALSRVSTIRLTPFMAAYEHMLPASTATQQNRTADGWLPVELNQRASSLILNNERVAQESCGWKVLHQIYARRAEAKTAAL